MIKYAVNIKRFHWNKQLNTTADERELIVSKLLNKYKDLEFIVAAKIRPFLS